MRLATGFCLLLLTTHPAVAESIQLQQSGGGVFMVPVRINDVVTIPFILDSGAISASVAPNRQSLYAIIAYSVR